MRSQRSADERKQKPRRDACRCDERTATPAISPGPCAPLLRRPRQSRETRGNRARREVRLRRRRVGRNDGRAASRASQRPASDSARPDAGEHARENEREHQRRAIEEEGQKAKPNDFEAEKDEPREKGRERSGSRGVKGARRRREVAGVAAVSRTEKPGRSGAGRSVEPFAKRNRSEASGCTERAR